VTGGPTPSRRPHPDATITATLGEREGAMRQLLALRMRSLADGDTLVGLETRSWRPAHRPRDEW